MLRADTRGQAIQVGAVLLFAVLVIALSGYQAVIVPQQNEDIEFQHSLDTRSDFTVARTGVMNAALNGDQPVVNIDLGMDYPVRLAALNPAPVSGTVSTTATRSLSVSGVSDVCPDGRDETRQLQYEASYNYLNNEPTLSIENTVSYAQYNEQAVALSAQRLVTGDRINLVPLRNEYSRNGVSTLALEMTPGRVQTTSGVTDPTVTLPTRLSEDRWVELLDGEVPAGNIDVLNAGDGDPSNDQLQLTLSGEYTVICSPVGIGGDPPEGVRDTVTDGGAGGGDEVNPAGPNSVILSDVSLDSGNDIVTITLRNTGDEDLTLEQGRLPFLYTPDKNNVPTYALLNGNSADELRVRENFETIDEAVTIPASGGTEQLEFHFDQNVGDLFFGFSAIYSNGENYRYFIDVSDGSGGGGGSNPTGSAADVSYVDGSGSAARQGDESRLDFDIENTGSDSVTITNITIDTGSGSIKEVSESRGGQGAGQHEVYIDSSTPGLFEGDGTPYYDDNGATAYQLGTTQSLTENAELASGETAVVTVLDFRRNNGNTASVAGTQVTITLGFSDGTTRTFSFVPPGY